MSFGTDQGEIVVPTVAQDGSRILSDQEAIDQFRNTGQFLGKFKSVEDANRFSERLHQLQERQYVGPTYNQ